MDLIEEKINNRKDDIERIHDEWDISHSSSGKSDDPRADKRKVIKRWLHNFQPSEFVYFTWKHMFCYISNIK